MIAECTVPLQVSRSAQHCDFGISCVDVFWLEGLEAFLAWPGAAPCVEQEK